MYILHIPIILILINKLENNYNNDYVSHQNNKEITDNIISIYHALYLIISSILYLCNILSIDIYDYILFHSVIYTFNDLIKVYNNNNKMKYEITLHHILLICINMSRKLVEFETIYTYYLALNYLTEMSTPTLNISRNLYFLNKKNTFLFKLCTIATFILYFLFRVVLLIYLLIDGLNNNIIFYYKYKCILICSCQLLLLLLNCYWFGKITRLIIKHNNF